MPTPTLDTRNGVFIALWSENRRTKRKSMGTRDRAVAEARFAQWLLLGGHRGEVATGATGVFTVAELWKVYDEKHVERETAAPASIRYCWQNLDPHFGSMKLAEVDQTVVDDYEEKRVDGEIGRPSVPGTVRKELAALRACFNWHASPARGKKRLIDAKDVPAFILPEESDPRDRWLTRAEIDKLLTAAAGEGRMSRIERFFWLALETAARKQAILDLTWDRVDFETRMIHYAVPGRKQTKKRRPSVPISDRLLPVLRRMEAERTGDLVLDHGGAVWAAVQSAVRRAGLAPRVERGTGESATGTGISPHTLRHTAATHMARGGVPLYDIAGILGNTLAMVERVYAHHCPGRLQAAVNMISGKE